MSSLLKRRKKIRAPLRSSKWKILGKYAHNGIAPGLACVYAIAWLSHCPLLLLIFFAVVSKIFSPLFIRSDVTGEEDARTTLLSCIILEISHALPPPPHHRIQLRPLPRYIRFFFLFFSFFLLYSSVRVQRALDPLQSVDAGSVFGETLSPYRALLLLLHSSLLFAVGCPLAPWSVSKLCDYTLPPRRPSDRPSARSSSTTPQQQQWGMCVRIMWCSARSTSFLSLSLSSIYYNSTPHTHRHTHIRIYSIRRPYPAGGFVRSGVAPRF